MMYTSTSTEPTISVEASSPDEAADLVLKELRRIEPLGIGGDPMMDAFDEDLGGYRISFKDGSTGIGRD